MAEFDVYFVDFPNKFDEFEAQILKIFSPAANFSRTSTFDANPPTFSMGIDLEIAGTNQIYCADVSDWNEAMRDVLRCETAQVRVWDIDII